MARQRTTFGKLQRTADKQAKARAKQEKRTARADAPEDEPAEPAPVVDQAKLLDDFAALHTAYEDGRIPRDEFESRRELLSSQMIIE